MPIQKLTVLPLHQCAWQWQLEKPLRITRDLTFENVEGLLKPENFELWRDWVSKQDRDDLLKTDRGLVHRFVSEEHLISKPEADSQDLIYKTFVLLRLIRPTRERYSYIQLSLKGSQPDLFGFAEPNPVHSAPHLQLFNAFHEQHFKQLAELLPTFLTFAISGPKHLLRAVRFYETGYSQIAEPLLQFVTWMIGIESVLSDGQTAKTEKEIRYLIEQRMGSADVYCEAESELFAWKPEKVLIKDVLPDLFSLRNGVVHGTGVPPQFDDHKTNSPATGESVHYVDVLREAASFILRKLVLGVISEFNG